MTGKIEVLPSLKQIQTWGKEFGFSSVGISNIDLSEESNAFIRWLRSGYAGDMTYLKRNIKKRLHPELLVPETHRVISVTLDYLPPKTNPEKTLKDNKKAYIARYALGRDYHKKMRRQLAKLAQKIGLSIPYQKYRVFADSAPVLEKPLGMKANLGWIGKNTLLLNKDQGSWFFLGEIFTNAPLKVNQSTTENDCGKCSACISVCPTNAIIRPGELDARRCIAYLTIEHKGVIPVALRSLIGNRVFGCDDCQIFCPVNRHPTYATSSDFYPRNDLECSSLLDLFKMSEGEFERVTRGSAIRRINYDQWQRNLAIGIGNSDYGDLAIKLLTERMKTCSDMVAEHIDWAIRRLKSSAVSSQNEKVIPVNL